MELNENAKKWVAALRSGKYKQTRGALKLLYPYTQQVVGHCCLGVACEVYLKENLDGLEVTSTMEHARFDGDISALPPKVREWLGLRNSTGNYGESESLVNLNDVENYSFDQIADVIESQPLGLFSEPTPEVSSEMPQSQSSPQS